MQPNQLFSNTLTNQIADLVTELDPMLAWIDIDEVKLITYWQQAVRPDIALFRAELYQNIDWAVNRGELVEFKSYVWKKTKPVVELKERIERWLTENPDKSSGSVAALFSQHIQFVARPIPMVYKPDPRKEIRHTVSEILFYLNQVIDVVNNVWLPLHPETTEATTVLPNSKLPAVDTSTNNELTERERVLIHCYKQQPAILRGQPGYQDYMTYARPGDRTGYPNGSDRKATSLIRSIEKILSYLSDTERQQAEYEINTIRVNIS